MFKYNLRFFQRYKICTWQGASADICILKTECRGLLLFVGTFLAHFSACTIRPFSSVRSHAFHLSQVMMNALLSPPSKLLGKRVNKHNKPHFWIFSLGPSLPVRPQSPPQGLTDKHQSLARLKKSQMDVRKLTIQLFCVRLLSEDTQLALWQLVSLWS